MTDVRPYCSKCKADLSAGKPEFIDGHDVYRWKACRNHPEDSEQFKAALLHFAGLTDKPKDDSRQ